MKGIYSITNLINNKMYIGQAENINIRWWQHKHYYNNPVHMNSCPKLYKAINKYGIDNFQFSILEEIELDIDITDREEYWIKYYDTVNNGYNCIYPTQKMIGENNPNSTLTKDQVNEIKDLLLNSTISQQDIAKNYKVAFSTIYRINRGESWYDTNSDYPIRKWNELAHYGEKSGRSKLTDNEVIKIRQRYVNETPSQIWEDYKDLYSLSGFSKICRGETYKHLPVYNKTSKTWKNN